MEFCPTCGTMLLYELPYMDRRARFYCSTCPYGCEIESQVKIERHKRLVKKAIDSIFEEDDRKCMNKTSTESCPKCNHGEATFYDVQIRSADEPKTLFFTCTKCKHTWTRD